MSRDYAKEYEQKKQREDNVVPDKTIAATNVSKALARLMDMEGHTDDKLVAASLREVETLLWETRFLM